MNRRAGWPWLAGMLAVLALAPVGFWWLFARQTSFDPSFYFFPDRLGLSVRVSHAREAWARHWKGRPGVAPENAMRALMEATGDWDRWVKKYGAPGASVRLATYEEAVFNMLGEEAWLVFGGWDDAATTGGQRVGLVLLLRSDSRIKSRLGGLVELLFEDYQFTQTESQGVRLYEYRDRKLSRSLTFCHVGGWVCASMRQRGEGPLPALIAKARRQQKLMRAIMSSPGTPSRFAPWRTSEVAATPESIRLALEAYFAEMNLGSLPEQPSALALRARPREITNLIQMFTVQRGKPLTKKSRKRLEFWKEKLAGVEQVALRQLGDSLANLDLVIDPQGAAPAQWLKREDAPPTATAHDADRPTSSPLVARIDLASASARVVADLLIQWKPDLLEQDDPGDFWKEPLGWLIAQASSQADPAARVGMVVLAWPDRWLPSALMWLDRPPYQLAPASAGFDWTRAANLAQEGTAGVWWWNAPDSATLAVWAGPQTPVSVPNGNAEPPAGVAQIDFAAASRWFDNAPTVLLNKKSRRAFRKWQRTTSALALGFGEISAQVDRQDSVTILRTRSR